MSILNNSSAYYKPSADLVAAKIINKTKQTFSIMVDNFNQGSRLFWQNPEGLSPSGISAALGTDAKEVFQLHYALGQLISDIKPEAIQEGLSMIGQFTMNEDGTVSVVSSSQVLPEANPSSPQVLPEPNPSSPQVLPEPNPSSPTEPTP